MTNETGTQVEPKLPTYIVKLIRSENGRKHYPVKVGVSFETEKGNQRILWDIIPASIELRDCVMILVPYEEAAS
jgi:hypothetical protein